MSGSFDKDEFLKQYSGDIAGLFQGKGYHLHLMEEDDIAVDCEKLRAALDGDLAACADLKATVDDLADDLYFHLMPVEDHEIVLPIEALRNALKHAEAIHAQPHSPQETQS